MKTSSCSIVPAGLKLRIALASKAVVISWATRPRSSNHTGLSYVEVFEIRRFTHGLSKNLQCGYFAAGLPVPSSALLVYDFPSTSHDLITKADEGHRIIRTSSLLLVSIVNAESHLALLRYLELS